MTKQEQRNLNDDIRRSVRRNELPFYFEDKYDKTYHQIIWRLNREFGVRKLYKITKEDGYKWKVYKDDAMLEINNI